MASRKNFDKKQERSLWVQTISPDAQVSCYDKRFTCFVMVTNKIKILFIVWRVLSIKDGYTNHKYKGVRV